MNDYDDYESEAFRYAATLGFSEARKWMIDFVDTVPMSHRLRVSIKEWVNTFFSSDVLFANLTQEQAHEQYRKAKIQFYSCQFAATSADNVQLNSLTWMLEIYPSFLTRAQGDLRERVINTMQYSRNESIESEVVEKTKEKQQNTGGRFGWPLHRK